MGCNASPDATTDQTPGAEQPDGGDAGKIAAALAELSPDDAASAEKQRNCLVSGEPLGSMGAPKKVDVKGTDVWICCDHCEEKLLQSPDEYLAKLPSE